MSDTDRKLFRFPAEWKTFQFVAVLIAAQGIPGQLRAAPVETRCFVMEVYVSQSSAISDVALSAAQQVADSRPGIRLVVRSLDESEKARQRLKKIANHFRFDGSAAPVIYVCNRVIRKGIDHEDFVRQLQDALTMEVYTRRGCRRCEEAKRFLPTIEKRYPALQIVYREVVGSRQTQNQLNDLVRKHRKAASSTPVFHFCDQLTIGFDRPETTGRRLQSTLDHWSTACPVQPIKTNPTRVSTGTAQEVPARSPF